MPKAYNILGLIILPLIAKIRENRDLKHVYPGTIILCLLKTRYVKIRN